MVSKKIRDALVVQAKKEIDFARVYKQGMIWRWQKNEDMYYARKMASVGTQDEQQSHTRKPQPEARANVELGKMQSFVHTYLSKIRAPLYFEYKKGSMADLKRATLLNALKEKDANQGDWNYKDLMGKKQDIIYGRAIFAYYADSLKGYKSHLENIDVYDFLVDPSGGGYDLDKAMYLGRFGVRKTKSELRKGITNGEYLTTETRILINGTGDPQLTTQEETNKQNRYSYVGSPANRQINDPDLYKLWEWYTTYDGQRYYMLYSEDFGTAIRVELLSDLFKINDDLDDAMWPIWSYACFPDLTEFWTPSYCDYVREIFMGQSTNINQMLDNAERINKPQRAVDVNAIENLADLVYKRNGLIRMKSGVDINKAFMIVQTTPINTPMLVYDKLEAIAQLESGVTAGVKGNAQEDKVAIYEGNQATSADRFALTSDTVTQGYKRFARLYLNGTDDHLTKKVAVKILGPRGMEKTVWIGKRDIKPQAEYDVMIKSSQAEAQADVIDKKNKMNFLNGYKANPIVNQKALFETGAEIVGFNYDEIREFLDLSEYGDSELISEAERDIEDLINGKIIEPNERANTVYASHILDYMRDHKEDMDQDTFLLFTDYMQRVEPIIVRNMGTQFQNKLSSVGGIDSAGGGATVDPMTGAPTAPGVGGQNLPAVPNNNANV